MSSFSALLNKNEVVLTRAKLKQCWADDAAVAMSQFGDLRHELNYED